MKKNRQYQRKKITSLLELGDHYNRFSEYDKAIASFKLMSEAATELNDLKGLMNASEGLAIANEGKNNVGLALKHFKQFTQYKDSLFTINKTEQLDEMQTRFALDLKEKELALKDNEIALLQREQKLNISRQWLLLLSLLLVTFFWRFNIWQIAKPQQEEPPIVAAKRKFEQSPGSIDGSRA